MVCLTVCFPFLKRELGWEGEKVWREGCEYEEALLSFVLKPYSFLKAHVEAAPII